MVDDVKPQEFAFQHPASPGGDWPALIGTPDDEPSLSRGGGGGGGGGEAWPPGSIFLTLSSSSPAVLLGYGTWTPLAQGEVLIGSGGGYGGAGNTGGQEWGYPTSHPFIPQHLHGVFIGTDFFTHSQVSGRQGTSAGNVLTTPVSHSHIASGNTGYDSGVSLPDHDPINVTQPYLVVNIWYRVS